MIAPPRLCVFGLFDAERRARVFPGGADRHWSDLAGRLKEGHPGQRRLHP